MSLLDVCVVIDEKFIGQRVLIDVFMTQKNELAVELE
jgi:hypothetical protein